MASGLVLLKVEIQTERTGYIALLSLDAHKEEQRNAMNISKFLTREW